MTRPAHRERWTIVALVVTVAGLLFFVGRGLGDESDVHDDGAAPAPSSAGAALDEPPGEHVIEARRVLAEPERQPDPTPMHVSPAVSAVVVDVAAPPAPELTAASPPRKTLAGRVLLMTAPPAAIPTTPADPLCLQAWPEGIPPQDVLVHDGGLQDVFVWVVRGPSPQPLPAESAFPPDDAGPGATDGKLTLATPAPVPPPIALRFETCLLKPRVLGLRLGTDLLVTNADHALQNLHVKAVNNPQANVALPGEGFSIALRFRRPETMVSIVCDLHPWERGFVGVLDHGDFAVTDVDGGWRIEGLAPGHYRLGFWHEVFGRRLVDVQLRGDSSGETRVELVMDEA